MESTNCSISQKQLVLDCEDTSSLGSFSDDVRSNSGRSRDLSDYGSESFVPIVRKSSPTQPQLPNIHNPSSNLVIDQDSDSDQNIDPNSLAGDSRTRKLLNRICRKYPPIPPDQVPEMHQILQHTSSTSRTPGQHRSPLHDFGQGKCGGMPSVVATCQSATDFGNDEPANECSGDDADISSTETEEEDGDTDLEDDECAAAGIEDEIGPVGAKEVVRKLSRDNSRLRSEEDEAAMEVGNAERKLGIAKIKDGRDEKKIWKKGNAGYYSANEGCNKIKRAINKLIWTMPQAPEIPRYQIPQRLKPENDVQDSLVKAKSPPDIHHHQAYGTQDQNGGELIRDPVLQQIHDGEISNLLARDTCRQQRTTYQPLPLETHQISVENGADEHTSGTHTATPEGLSSQDTSALSLGTDAKQVFRDGWPAYTHEGKVIYGIKAPRVGDSTQLAPKLFGEQNLGIPVERRPAQPRRPIDDKATNAEIEEWIAK
ncbi:hypothetical protein AC579_5312 [Pseudocercospora musae]|uniref:Uncharacterized protein n=1 Tax=Pseudocercospora musae TaxID=113226 RepID=A0A139HZI9_9PEZI|nr:hypothetical protein AC579_5312 [Pseudocercospora musae]